MRILFVDDDEVTLFLYKVLMKSFPDFTAFFAKDGKEALDIIGVESQAIDIMFLDINMPVMDGFELLRNHELLSASKKVASLYIMLGTDIAEEKKTRLFTFNGVKDCLAKPLRKEVFVGLTQQIPK